MDENNKPEVAENKIQKYWEPIWELIKIALIALIIVVPIRYFLFQPFIVSGDINDAKFSIGRLLNC